MVTVSLNPEKKRKEKKRKELREEEKRKEPGFGGRKQG